MNEHTFFSSLFLAGLAVIGGLVMLIGGGETMVSGATRLARRLGMSPLVIGLTIVAFGTSVPELFVSLTASLQGHTDITIGNVVGSNIANIGLILGICGLTAPLTLTLKEVWNELLLVVSGSVILMLATVYGHFPRILGLLFTLTLIGYTVITYRNNMGNSTTATDGQVSNDVQQESLVTAMIVDRGSAAVFATGLTSGNTFSSLSGPARQRVMQVAGMVAQQVMNAPEARRK
jgi:cation:H+ antiporter